MILPTVAPYAGANTTALRFGDALTVYFSYSTPVAFMAPGTGIVARINVWGPTTGKHISEIDGGEYNARLRHDGEMFEEMLQEQMHKLP
ncbi:MAG TPA: hypothetical protein VNA25_04940 [Phycisphaerae bacterium]|nr:hypothetical protein [Phycisphaerae bacterium]